MSETKHTPGPWSLNDEWVSDKGHYEAPRVFSEADADNPKFICEVAVGPQWEEDGRLISAAPELLAALKGARRFLYTALQTSLVHCEPEYRGVQSQHPQGWVEIAKTRMPDWAGRQLLDECDEAIAKAEGRQ